MKKIFLLVATCLSIVACSNDESSSNPSVSITPSNADTFSKLGFQQFIALHSNEMLVRNTILNQPLFATPCNSGAYSFTFTDTDNNSSFSVGDSVIENYSNCALNAGDIVVSGVSTSTVTERTIGLTFGMDVTHSNLNVSINGKTYTYNGLIKTRIKTDSVLTEMTNQYRDYSISFGSNSMAISSGRTEAAYNFNDRAYSINQAIVFTGNRFNGILRADTTTAVIGDITPTGKPLFSGDPLLDPIAEDNAIDQESDTTQKQTLKDARAAFRGFTGRLRIESVTDNQFVDIDSDDNDDDVTTYVRNVRANSRNQPPINGLKWVDLLS